MIAMLNEYIYGLRRQSWHHRKFKDRQGLTKINKNGAVVKVRILVELGMYMNLAAILGAMLKY